MSYQQNTQSFCNRCDKHTLHIRTVQTVTHVLHLLVSLLCFIWIPVWILLTISNSLSKEPFRCSVCGTKSGSVPRDVRQARKQEQQQFKAERQAERDRLASTPEAIAAREEKAELWRQRRAAILTELKETPGRINRGLKFIAGEGNDIIYRTLQVTAILLCVVIPVLLIWFVASTVSGWFS